MSIYVLNLVLPMAIVYAVAYAVNEYRGKDGTMGAIKVIYAVAIAAFIIMSLVFGVSAFYEEPDYPSGYGDWEAHEEEVRDHQRTIFFMCYPVGLALFVLGLLLRRRVEPLSPGLLLGGFGVMVFALAQGELSDLMRFVGAFVALVLLTWVGYRTLIDRMMPQPARAEE